MDGSLFFVRMLYAVNGFLWVRVDRVLCDESSNSVQCEESNKSSTWLQVQTLIETQHEKCAHFCAPRIGIPALRQLGVDEIHLGKKQKFLTVASNLESGEPL